MPRHERGGGGRAADEAEERTEVGGRRESGQIKAGSGNGLHVLVERGRRERRQVGDAAQVGLVAGREDDPVRAQTCAVARAGPPASVLTTSALACTWARLMRGSSHGSSVSRPTSQKRRAISARSPIGRLRQYPSSSSVAARARRRSPSSPRRSAAAGGGGRCRPARRRARAPAPPSRRRSGGRRRSAVGAGEVVEVDVVAGVDARPSPSPGGAGSTRCRARRRRAGRVRPAVHASHPGRSAARPRSPRSRPAPGTTA